MNVIEFRNAQPWYKAKMKAKKKAIKKADNRDELIKLIEDWIRYCVCDVIPMIHIDDKGTKIETPEEMLAYIKEHK